MLEWAAPGDGPTLALLVDHDDAEREFSYVSTAETFAETEPITDVARPPGLDRGQHGARLGDASSRRSADRAAGRRPGQASVASSSGATSASLPNMNT